MPKRSIEREFGVPIAGEILPRERWMQTALKRLPTHGPIQWEALFGRRAPVVLDLGCGNGRYLIGSAVWRPDHDHLGADVLPLVIRYATRRSNQRGLSNVRFAVAEGRQLLERWVEPGSVSEIHCYHPQPYRDPALAHRRLITPGFLLLVRRALLPGGQLVLQTDSPGYWRYIQQVMPTFFSFEERTRVWPDAPKGRTRREIIALRRGLKVYRGQGSVRPGLSDDEARYLARTMPMPVFDTELELDELDELERREG
jgi:tRNA (guanine-N7-)-methyltransferase